jgi:non-ribosomal peptide synthetase component F
MSVTAVERSLNALLARHETLRTSFAVQEGQPVQVVAPPTPRLLPVVDLQALPEAVRLAQAQALVMAEAQRPFDLGRGPLWRATWLALAPDEHILLTNTHHIISDAWSSGIFFGELIHLYQAFRHHEPAALAPLPVQYGDFALWQRQWLQGAVLERQLAYWRQQLAQPPVLELPTDYPRPPVQTFRGAVWGFDLPPALAAEVKRLSNQEGVTLFMTVLAAFQALLARYSGQEDIIVGTPIANRNRFETEGLIGFFVNTLVLRTSLSGRPSFRELLSRVRHTTLGAYDHQDLPFEKLVEELQPKRDLSRNPLFQVMFILDREQGVSAEESAG